MRAVEISNLTKIIRKNTVLDHVNLQLEAGGIYGFYGPNGSGKSMLFRAVCGIIHPTEGEVRVCGKKLGEDVSFPESLGVIIENVGFWKAYTGFENLQILASIKKQIGEAEIRDALSRVGLDPRDKRKYGKYSLGMKQRLGIAQAIMEKPQLLVLDEPTNALDYDGIELIRDVIRQEQDRGATVLLASHNPEDLAQSCDRFFQMHSGGRLRETKGLRRGQGGESHEN